MWPDCGHTAMADAWLRLLGCVSDGWGCHWFLHSWEQSTHILNPICDEMLLQTTSEPPAVPAEQS